MQKEYFEEIPLKGKYINLDYMNLEKGFVMDFHCHKGFEINQIVSGEGTLLIEDSIYEIKNDSIYIINALDLHKTNLNPDIPYLRTGLSFFPEYLIKFFDSGQVCELLSFFYTVTIKKHSKVPLDRGSYTRINNILKNMHEETEHKDSKDDLLIALKLMEILIIIYRAYEKSDVTLHKTGNPLISDGKINKILDYINQYLIEGITLEKLEKELNLSRYYICHVFKDKTGFTVIEYMLNRKIAEAKRLLLNTNRTITEIAHYLSFCDAPYFSRTFKKIVGLSPQSYRASASIAILNP